MSSFKIAILYALFMLLFVSGISGQYLWTFLSGAAIFAILIHHYYGRHE
jgi:hypothetical protein